MKYFYNGDNENQKYDNRLRLMITYIVSEDTAFRTIKLKSNTNNPNTDYIPPTNTCFYHMLNNPKKNVILPEFEEVNNKNLFLNPQDFTSETFNSDNIKQEYVLPSEKLKVKYDEIKERISKYSRNINSYHEDNTIYYKIWLLFITMSGFLVSIFTLIFFGIETGWFSTTFEEWFFNNYKTLTFIITLFVLIIGSMIINL